MSDEPIPPIAPAGRPSVRPRLRVIHVSGSSGFAAVELVADQLSMGRHFESDVRCDEQLENRVSGRHARIVFEAAGFWLEDTHSKNGTYVNGQRIRGSHRLDAGDRISLGPPSALGSAMLIVEIVEHGAEFPVCEGACRDRCRSADKRWMDFLRWPMRGWFRVVSRIRAARALRAAKKARERIERDERQRCRALGQLALERGESRREIPAVRLLFTADAEVSVRRWRIIELERESAAELEAWKLELELAVQRNRTHAGTNGGDLVTARQSHEVRMESLRQAIDVETAAIRRVDAVRQRWLAELGRELLQVEMVDPRLEKIADDVRDLQAERARIDESIRLLRHRCGR